MRDWEGAEGDFLHDFFCTIVSGAVGKRKPSRANPGRWGYLGLGCPVSRGQVSQFGLSHFPFVITEGLWGLHPAKRWQCIQTQVTLQETLLTRRLAWSFVMSLNLLVRPQEGLPWSQGHGWRACRSSIFPGTSPGHVEHQVWGHGDSVWMQPSCWGNRSNDDSSGWWSSSPGESPRSLSCCYK